MSGDHRLAADGVEEAAEDERPEEVGDGEDRDVERHRPGADVEEFAEQGAEVEGDGVVEEGLADEQREAEDRAPRVVGEGGAGDLAERDPLRWLDRDALVGLGELLRRSPRDLLLDLADDLARPPPRGRG